MAAPIRTFVISLADNSARRQQSASALDDAGLDFEFFDAIRGEVALDPPHFAGIDESRFLLHTGRMPTNGEKGCFASHRVLWRRCVELGESILIMEDDFRLLDGFLESVRHLADTVDEFGYVRLQTDVRTKMVEVRNLGRFSLCRYTKPPHSTMCYGISPATAASWLEQTDVIADPVDVFIKRYWDHGQALHAIVPFTVTESVLAADTDIPHRVKDRKPLPVALRRLATKLGWYRRRYLFNLRQR